MFIGSPVGGRSNQPCEFAPRFPCGDARRRLFVVRTGLNGRSAAHRHRYHDQLDAHVLSCDEQPIVGVQRPGRLYAFTIDMNQSTRDCVRRLRAALEKTGTPQPFVYAQAAAYLSVIVSHRDTIPLRDWITPFRTAACGAASGFLLSGLPHCQGHALREALHRFCGSRCASDRLIQGTKRSPYVDMGKLCNAVADDPRRNPFNDQELLWDESGLITVSLLLHLST